MSSPPSSAAAPSARLLTLLGGLVFLVVVLSTTLVLAAGGDAPKGVRLASAGTVSGAPGAAAAATKPGAIGPSAASLSARASGIADEVVERWAALQRPDGRFPDPIVGLGGDYGTAMLGLAMAERGVDRGDRGLIDGGLRALLAQVSEPSNGSFELLALARAQRWASANLPSSPVGAPLWAAAGPRLNADLAQRGPVSSNPAARGCNEDASCYNNLKLVSNLGQLELLATGLKPSTPTALLADPNLRPGIIERLTNRVPRETGGAITRTGSAPLAGGGILSDPPRNPIAYSALSAVMLGQLLTALGPDAPRAADKALGRAERGLLLLAAPNGDLTYWGRGQGQVWVPAMVANAAAAAAERAQSSTLRGRYLALAQAALQQLRDRYGVGVAGLPLVPGAVDAKTLAARRVDSYATTRSYNGLAVAALDQAAKTLARIGKATATTVPASRHGVVRSPRQAGIATFTRGSLWAAVAAKSRSAGVDARYASGLLALQRRNAAGDWAPILPGRPFSTTDVSTLGIELSGGRFLVPSGVIGKAHGSGVDINGGWSNRRVVAKTLDPGTTWRWQLVGDDTLEVRFTARAARTVVLSGLIAQGAAADRAPHGVVVRSEDASALRYTLEVSGRSLPLRRSRAAVGASAFDSGLEVAQLRGAVRRGERVVVRIKAVASPVASTG